MESETHPHTCSLQDPSGSTRKRNQVVRIHPKDGYLEKTADGA